MQGYDSWTVTDQDGTVYTYNHTEYASCISGPCIGQKNIEKVYLTKIGDVYGNKIEIEYSSVRLPLDSCFLDMYHLYEDAVTAYELGNSYPDCPYSSYNYNPEYTGEFIDVTLGYVGCDPKETYERNVEIIKQGGLVPNFTVRDNNDYKKILETQGTLKHGFVRRDISKIRDLSKLLSFIKGVKNSSYDVKVGLNDIAVSIGIVLESKSITGTEHGNLMTLVNDARLSYNIMHRESKIPSGYGLRQGIWQAALYAGNENGFEAYVNTLNQEINRLNTQATNVAQATLRSRILADLVVLGHFSKAYQNDVEFALKEKDENMFEAFSKLYESKKSKSSVYEHRLDSILR